MPKQSSIKPRKLYLIGPHYRGTHGVIFANEDALVTPPRVILGPPTGQRGFPELSETPLLRYDRKKGKMPRDIELFGPYWLISELSKQVFESVDHEAFAFVSCDFILPDGSRGAQYYLCDVVRVIDALDEANSRIRSHFEPSGRKVYSLVGGASVAFHQDKIVGVHIFRQPNFGGNPVCDQILRNACKASGLKGFLFEDVTDL